MSPKQAKEKDAALLCLPECFHFLGRKSAESVAIGEKVPPLFSAPCDSATEGDAASGAVGASVESYQRMARDVGIWLSLGGFQEASSVPNKIYNSHLVISSTGQLVGHYRKAHLFDVHVPNGPILNESSFTLPGEDLIVCDSPIGKLGLTTCYDLRFPAMYGELAVRGAEILLVPSAFTVPTGEAHWEILLRARAIETQCFVVAAAQVGQHNEKRESYGRAMIISPWGDVLADCGRENSEPRVMVAEVDLARLGDIRTRMPCASHKRPALYRDHGK